MAFDAACGFSSAEAMWTQQLTVETVEGSAVPTWGCLSNEERNEFERDAAFVKQWHSDVNELSCVEALDAFRFYLRSVHLYCYYSGNLYQDQYDLRRRAGARFVRPVLEGAAPRGPDRSMDTARQE